jgi:hypothetical protein
VLLSTLDLDLAYVGLAGDDLAPLDAIRSKPQDAAAQLLPAARAALHRPPTTPAASGPATIAHPDGGPPLRVCTVRSVSGRHRGALVAGSRRPGFPSGHERLLLGVAANQAAVVLQRRLAERRSSAASRASSNSPTRRRRCSG